MKKTLLLLLFAVSFSAFSQVVLPQEYSIHKPLLLETVNPSTTSADSVLVRGVDKIVKYVPRSEFGGGTSTLNGIMTNGENIVVGDPEFGYKTITLKGFSPSDYLNLSPGGIYISGSSSIFTIADNGYSIGNGSHNLNADADGFSYSADGITSRRYNYPIPTNNISKTLPISVNGEYANANGDITFSVQQLMNSLYRHGDLDGGGTQFDLFTGTPYERSFKVSTSNLGGTIQEGITFQSGYYEMFGLYTDEFSNVWNSRFKLTNGEPVISRNFNYGGEVNIRVNPDLGAGEYKFSVAVTYINSTTVDKTQTDLFTEYPSSMPGDKVQCMDIVPTPKIYERTQYGWAEYPVTIVAP